MSTVPDTKELIGEFAAESLGCSRQTLTQSGIHIIRCAVTKHPMTRCAHVCEITHSQSRIVRVPDRLATMVEDEVEKLPSRDSILEERFWKSVFGKTVKKIGPNWTGFADRNDFQPRDLLQVRPLAESDASMIEKIAKACPEAEMDPSGFVDAQFPVYVCEAGGTLSAVAAVASATGRIAKLQVAVLPAFRRQGLASIVITALAMELFNRDFILGWSTWNDNAASVALAKRMGFWQHDTDWVFIPEELWSG